MENNKQKYNEAVKGAAELICVLKEQGLIGDDGFIESNLKAIFPELRESEDERIRKEIEKSAKSWYNENYGRGANPQGPAIVIGAYIDGALAWLEKHKKPNIELVQRSWYMEGYHDCESNKEPMWVVKAEKGGPKYYANPNYGKQKEQKPCGCVNVESEYDKGWRDGHEAGFKDAEALRPDDREILAKHITEDSLSDDVNARLAKCGWYVGEKKPDDDSLNDRRFIEGFDTGREVQKIFDKPAEWSEEEIEKSAREYADENPGLCRENDGGVWLGDFDKPYYDFMAGFDCAKSHISQPKQEWSEEDEKACNNVLNGLKYAHEDLINHKSFDSAKDVKEAFDWMQARLKPLRPDNYKNCNSRWKPSEEQMGALNYAYCELFKRKDVDHNILGPLQSVIDNLEKLIQV